MNQYKLSLIRQFGPTLPAGHHAVYIIRGVLDMVGQSIQAGDAAYISTTNDRTFEIDSSVLVLCFTLELDSDSLAARRVERDVMIRHADQRALMRLDEVRFPKGAVAWRHTHPGPGIRYLMHGQLTLEGDDHATVVRSGDAWFEDADSPVKASASVQEETTFIRCMILPVKFEGRPTINILDPQERNQPMRQENRRHIDQCIRLVP